jgi:uracil-DNA glycosylase
MDLEKLYKGVEVVPDNPLCAGCSILKKNKPCYAILDYEEQDQSDILFLSDSLKYKFGKTYPFTDKEEEIIRESFNKPFAVAASVKCPSVKEADMNPASMNICRQHLEATINKIKPKLVYACGNLAMKMLIKKSGITDKRGNSYDFKTDAGHKCVVVPILHPFAVIQEPRHKPVFDSDISNGYNKHILGKVKETKMDYSLVKTVTELSIFCNWLNSYTKPIALDIETTGLDFLKDRIMTLAIATDEKSAVIPIYHKEFSWSSASDFVSMDQVFNLIQHGLRGSSVKVLHNAKFDLKFLRGVGVTFGPIADTKMMAHMINEEGKNSLKDLVKQYFPEYLEKL